MGVHEFMCGAYELLVVAGWEDVALDDDADELRSAELTHPQHCPHDPVNMQHAFAIMFAAARARQPLA